MFLFAAFFAATAAADEGMWLLPYLQKMNIADMRAKGCELSAEEIYAADRSSLKDAIVIFGAGCTGEVVSPEGLLLTNHHCGYGAIQSLSSVEHDFLKNGFWARSRAEELPAPGLEVRFVRRIADVTADVLGAVPSTAMGEERAELVKKQVAEVRKRFGKEYPGMEISVKPFFGGNQYFAFAMEVYKDIRLVGTPPNSIGKFGGDTDNWMWPRHTGDFSMFRIYAGKDNRPAEYSTKNVPYRADEYLRISLDGYDEGDFAMIMGFPGSTQRYMTSYEIDRMLTITNPQRIFIRGERQKILAEDMLASDKVRIQYASKYAQSSNYWKNAMGMSRGIERLDVKRKKQEQERAFQQWAEANSVDGKRYDEALGMIRDAIAASNEAYAAQQYLNEGDVIVFHYTDDYLKEYEAEQNRTKTAEEVIAMIDAIGTVDLSKAGAISAARSAYDKLTDAEKALVTNYNVLVEAEAAYAKLVAEMGKKLDEIYKTTGDFMGTLGTPTVNSIGGEWMVIGLARSGRPVPAGYYDNVVEYVKAKADANERLHPAKVTDNARVILALTSIGKDVTNVGGHNLLKGLDNMDYIQTQGINGPIWALIALDSHNYPTMGDVTREKLIQVILDAQLSNGGWNLSGNDADPDMTAMAIQSLAPYYKENKAVKAAVDKALDVLSELQLATGGFGSWGTENSESCAQVIVALTALGIDPAKDSRFIKNGLTILDALASYYVDGGGFRHTASGELDGMATEQGYYALAAYYRFVNGQTSLYDMSDVTIKANDQPVQPTDPTTPGTPATGDNQPVMLWFGSVLISGAAILLLAQKKKKVR